MIETGIGFTVVYTVKNLFYTPALATVSYMHDSLLTVSSVYSKAWANLYTVYTALDGSLPLKHSVDSVV